MAVKSFQLHHSANPNLKRSHNTKKLRNMVEELDVDVTVKLSILPKLKLLRKVELNHLTIILTLTLTCEPKLPFNK